MCEDKITDAILCTTRNMSDMLSDWFSKGIMEDRIEIRMSTNMKVMVSSLAKKESITFDAMVIAQERAEALGVRTIIRDAFRGFMKNSMY